MKKLDRAEYDFTRIDRKEWRAAAYYEYARESAFYCRLAKETPKLITTSILKSTDFSDLKELVRSYFSRPAPMHEHYDFYPLGVVLTCAEFPLTPWGKLSNPTRLWLCDEAREIRKVDANWKKRVPAFLGLPVKHSLGVAGGVRALNEASEDLAKHLSLPQPFSVRSLYCALVCVNPMHDRNAILQRFTRWLDGIHPPRRGRHSYRDALNTLCALRLRFFCSTLPEALRCIQGLHESQPRYAYRSTFDDAVQNATRYFHQLLHLPSEDKPVHYTTGWRS